MVRAIKTVKLGEKVKLESKKAGISIEFNVTELTKPVVAETVGAFDSAVLGRAAGQRDDSAATEKEKIEDLIKHVEGLKDTVFVRNDKEYDAKTAARFMRGKWDANKDKVKTANDFIEEIASVSSTTGKPYLIRFRDGTEKKSGEYLKAELKKLEK